MRVKDHNLRLLVAIAVTLRFFLAFRF